MRIAAMLFLVGLAAPGAPARSELQIYFLDVEGGQATLIVTPAGESMLVDAGWPGNNARDAKRIAAAAKEAGVSRIDYFLMTHYHRDHAAGTPELLAHIPVGTFIDHGPNTETTKQGAECEALYKSQLHKGKHMVVKPGDRIPLKGVEVIVVAARGVSVATALKGAGAPNAACATTKPMEADSSENARSVGFLLKFGKFRFVDLADMTWNTELAMVCPNNKVGTTDLFLVSHHGASVSNSPALLGALGPRVAVMNNGARKGGDKETFQRLRALQGLEDLWQLHYSIPAGEANGEESLIANPEEKCAGYAIHVSARGDGSFRVTNRRNGVSKTYPARKN